MLLKLHAKLAPGGTLIRVNIYPIQEIGPKAGGGHSFERGPLFRETTVQVYIIVRVRLRLLELTSFGY